MRTGKRQRQGVWHKFVYSDDSDGVTFNRLYAKKYSDGTYTGLTETYKAEDWKKK